VKEVFLDRLAGTHPHLLDDYRRRYRDRAYAPKADQEALAATVRDLLRRHGGTAALRADARPSPAEVPVAPPTSSPVAEGHQLSLL
jgi:hypothetical protein